MGGIHRGPVNSPHKGPVTRKMFPFDDVIMFYMYKTSRQHSEYVAANKRRRYYNEPIPTRMQTSAIMISISRLFMMLTKTVPLITK